MRVCVVPEYPVSLMTGGLQVQAEETWRALGLIGNGVTAELFDWSQMRPLPDLYHFFGAPPYLPRLCELVRAAGKPYVVTVLLGSSHRGTRLWLSRGRHLVRSRLLREGGIHDAVGKAASVVTLNETDANAARFIFGWDAKRLHVVPNGVDKSFFQASPEPWRRRFGARPFVLCVGAIQKRKNQLLLTEACNRLRLPVVLLGPVLPGEQEYADRVRIAIQTNTAIGGQWLTNLRNEDELLTSAFAACRVFALLSAAETQPLSVMQAMAARRPVLLLSAGYCKDRLFRTLPTVDNAEIDTVVNALKRVWEEPKVTELSHEYTWEQVARRLVGIYQCVGA